MVRRYEQFLRSGVDPNSAEVLRVQRLADQLASWIDQLDGEISAAHVHGAQSAAIQSLVGAALSSVGFVEEQVLTAQEGFSTRARPDFFFRLSDGRGIIAEVERGGAVNNNHDLKDMWKAHIASDAQHLFLIVPFSNWLPDGSPREKPFARVLHRYGSFFGEPRREVDVDTCFVFGYGASGVRVAQA